ncbi:MAG: sigma-70 family RNA polymerase sigma factor [Myxococcota bacterium]
MPDDSIEQLYRDGQRAWPELRLDQAAFAAHCESIGASGAASLDAAGIYLCCACARGDTNAVNTFERHCLDTALAAITRVRSERDFAQEAVQAFREKLLVGPPPKVLDYRGRGPLQAWVRVAAQRVALDLCRARQLPSLRQLELNEGLVSADPTPELQILRERHLPELREALQIAIAGLSPQERNVLRMHVVGRCSIDEIGRAYRVHRATAARWLERIREGVHDAIRTRMCTRLTSSEFESLARELGGELSLGLSASAVPPSGLTSRAGA